MTSVGMSDIDLECGGIHGRSSSAGSDGDGGGSDDESVCFSDAEEGSCYSQFYSTVDGSYDDYSFACASDPETAGVSDSRRVSAAAEESDCSVDIEHGIREVKVHLERVQRDCRICHMSLENPNSESGIAIELGCSCKEDLAAAHKNCAEAWFKIRGNKTCEICNSVAHNVFDSNENASTQQTGETNAVSAQPPPAAAAAETQSSCMNGHRLMNSLLACMVFAFVISWLFHFNVPS